MAELKLDSTQALLHLGATGSEVKVGGAGGPVVHMALGYTIAPAALFRGDIPTALELENAIAAVEDQVMPAVRQLPGVTELVTTDPELCALAAAASVEAGGVLSLERIEWLFDELSRVVLGGPATGLPFAPTRRAAVALLILRELMHHGNFRALRRLDGDAAHFHRA